MHSTQSERRNTVLCNSFANFHKYIHRYVLIKLYNDCRMKKLQPFWNICYHMSVVMWNMAYRWRGWYLYISAFVVTQSDYDKWECFYLPNHNVHISEKAMFVKRGQYEFGINTTNTVVFALFGQQIYFLSSPCCRTRTVACPDGLLCRELEGLLHWTDLS